MVNWNLDIINSTPEFRKADGFDNPDVDAIYIKNEMYQGKQTEVFAWFGMPKLAAGQKCPAMILLHGGGGGAFIEWVKIWNARGYAAIAIDQCGDAPEYPCDIVDGPHSRQPNGGPAGWDASFKTTNEAITEQWVYHAISAALRCHGLLANHPAIDASKIGVTGISWGGYMTSLFAGVDTKLACAVPVYGCGFLGVNSVWNSHTFPSLPADDVKRWLELWDPSVYLPNAKCPICWVSGSNDFAYPMDSLTASANLPKSPQTLSIRVELPHSHPDGWAPKEIYKFIDSHLADGKPMPQVLNSGYNDKEIWLTYNTDIPVKYAELNYTRATGYLPDGKYNKLPAAIDAENGSVKIELPPFTTAAYLNIFDEDDCVVSGDVMVLK
jgi:dienelactone hydrolase